MSQLVLQQEEALVGADLTPAYLALKQVTGLSGDFTAPPNL
jgi:hypothetical protein